MLIELLTFKGCPNAQAARKLIERVAADLAADVEIRDVDVPDLTTAQRLRFLGSPSIRVNGRDIEPAARARGDFGPACRVYQTEDGPAGLPDEELLLRALLADESNASPSASK